MIAVCITTLNEATTIYNLVSFFIKRDFMVIVVDDASTDGTDLIAILAGAHVERNDQRIGIGPSLLRAWEAAVDADCTGVLQIDAGESHDPCDYYKFLDAVTHIGLADVVIGSRFCAGAVYDNTNGSWKRPFLSRLATFVMNRAQMGAHYTDWTSGYRYFSRRALDTLLTRRCFAKMHGWQIEVLAYAGESGLTIVEVPITYRAGRSSFSKKVAVEAFQVFLHVIHHVRAVLC